MVFGKKHSTAARVDFRWPFSSASFRTVIFTSSHAISWRCSSVSPASRQPSAPSSVGGTLDEGERLWCNQRVRAGFERSLLAGDALEFAIGLGFTEMAADRETQDPIALGLEAINRASERDALGLRDSRFVLDAQARLRSHFRDDDAANLDLWRAVCEGKPLTDTARLLDTNTLLLDDQNCGEGSGCNRPRDADSAGGRAWN